MKISTLLRTLLLTTALLISAGTSSHLDAQTLVNDTPITTFTPIGVTRLIVRSYTGTATQTSAEGIKTTGTFTLSYFKGGSLKATTVFNGVSTTYDGTLPKAPSGSLQGTRTGFVLMTYAVQTNLDGSVTFGQTVVPVLVDKGVARGGLQNADGSALTFYAERDATINGGH